MRLSLLALTVAALLTCGGRATLARAAAPAAAAKPSTAPSGTVYAFRQIALARPGDVDTLPAMIALAAEEHADMLGLQPERAAQLVQFARTASAGTVGLHVALESLKLPPDKLRANEFITKVTDSLEQQLREQYVRNSGVTRAEEDVNEIERSLAWLRDEIGRTEQEVRQVTGRADASVEAIRASAPKLDDERLALKLQIVGKQARQQALATAIERLSKAAAERAKDDPVAAELEKVVVARERALARTLTIRKAGQPVSEAEVSAAEVDLAESRARMLERRDAVSQANGGDLLTALNRELATVSIDLAEAEAKLAEAERLLKGYAKVQELLAKADDLRRQRDQAEHALVGAKGRLADAENSIPQPVLRVTKSLAKRLDEPGDEPPGFAPQP
jgi:predicted  nucleic acid-binding Zn-ribbon protein